MASELSMHIKNRRVELKLAQGQLATIVGVSRGTIRNVESGNAMEESTQRGLERALGWLPNTTKPFVNRETMVAISRGLLTRIVDADEFTANSLRNDFHAFLADLLHGNMDPLLAQKFVAEIIGNVPPSRGFAAWSELSSVAEARAKVEGGDVRAVSATAYATMATSAVVKQSGPQQVLLDDYGISADKLDATARPATVRASAHVPSPAADDEQEERFWRRAYEGARERSGGGAVLISRMEIPREITTDIGRGYAFAVAPLPDDVMAELNDEDVEWLGDALREHGVALARRIAETKRLERASQEAQREEET